MCFDYNTLGYAEDQADGYPGSRQIQLVPGLNIGTPSWPKYSKESAQGDVMDYIGENLYENILQGASISPQFLPKGLERSRGQKKSASGDVYNQCNPFLS